MNKEPHSVQSLSGVPGAAILLLRALDKGRARTAAKAGLTGSEVRVLSRIAESTEITPKMVATSTDLSVSAVTALTDRLVARSLLRRVANPSDRRSLFLELTPTGFALINTLYETFRSLMELSLEHSSTPDPDRLELELRQLASALDKNVERHLAGTLDAAMSDL